MHIDPNLYDYATDKQREALEAIEKHGTTIKASLAIGLNKGAASAMLIAVKKRAAKEGYAPGHFDHGVAPGYAMGKVTVHRGPDGQIKNTWERQSPDDAERADNLRVY